MLEKPERRARLGGEWSGDELSLGHAADVVEHDLELRNVARDHGRPRAEVDEGVEVRRHPPAPLAVMQDEGNDGREREPELRHVEVPPPDAHEVLEQRRVIAFSDVLWCSNSR